MLQNEIYNILREGGNHMLKKGQKIKLNDFLSEDIFEIEITAFIQSKQLDITCFGVDKNNQLYDDRYFVFYNQSSSPNNAIVMNVANGKSIFKIDISRLPSFINKLAFCVTSDDNALMRNITKGTMVIKQNNVEIENFSFQGSDFSQERAIILSEIYNKDNIWKLSIVSRGFHGGLSKLLEHFGGEETKPDTIQYKKEKTDTLIHEQSHLQKPKTISLSKSGDCHKISLKKQNNPFIHVNLNWNNKQKGLFGMTVLSVDLDLACMYRLKNGNKGVIQALGNSFGSKTQEPYIFLDGDDRSGNVSSGENMYFFKPEEIDFAIVFAYIYDGIANWGKTDASIILKQKGASDIQMRIDSKNSKDRFCVISSFKQTENGLIVTKEEKYFLGHKEIDGYYGFGFRWIVGHK